VRGEPDPGEIKNISKELIYYKAPMAFVEISGKGGIATQIKGV
jgi:hypothetical protein